MKSHSHIQPKSWALPLFFVLLLGVVWLFPNSGFTQKKEYKAIAKPSAEKILIGEQFTIDLEIKVLVDDEITWPVIIDSLGQSLELVEKSEKDSVLDEKEFTQRVYTQTITLTSFEPGYHAVYPFTFVVNGEPVITDAFGVNVEGVVIDTARLADTAILARDIRDIKGPIEVKMTLWDHLRLYWPWYLGGLSTALVIGLLLLYGRKWYDKFKGSDFVKGPINRKPAQIIALDKLEKLRKEKLWQKGKFKKYHSEISEVLREYIRVRYRINAPEQTTDEIMHQLRLTKVSESDREDLQAILGLADLVKFAKEEPLGPENERSMDLALAFVRSTSVPEPEPVENQTNPTSDAGSD